MRPVCCSCYWTLGRGKVGERMLMVTSTETGGLIASVAAKSTAAAAWTWTWTWAAGAGYERVL